MGDPHTALPRAERRLLRRALVPMLRSTCGLSMRRAEQAATYLERQIVASGWLRLHDERVRAEGRR